MRREHAKHARAARKRTAADRQGARGLCPRAFPAKRRTQEVGPDPQGQAPDRYRAVATCASRRLEMPARSESPSLRVRMKNCTWYPVFSGNVARGNIVNVT